MSLKKILLETKLDYHRVMLKNNRNQFNTYLNKWKKAHDLALYYLENGDSKQYFKVGKRADFYRDVSMCLNYRGLKRAKKLLKDLEKYVKEFAVNDENFIEYSNKIEELKKELEAII